MVKSLSTIDYINQLRQLPPSPHVAIEQDEFHAQQGHDVGMNVGGVTNATSDHPVLGTTGLATCMGIAFYNPKTKATGLVHLAQDEANSIALSSGSRQALLGVLEKLGSRSAQRLEARIVGPYFDLMPDMPFCRDVLQILKDHPNLHILSADLGSKPFCQSFAVDARRWSEGLIKGSRPAVLSSHPVAPKGDDLKHIVDINLSAPPAHYYSEKGVFDVRGSETPSPVARLFQARRATKG